MVKFYKNFNSHLWIVMYFAMLKMYYEHTDKIFYKLCDREYNTLDPKLPFENRFLWVRGRSRPGGPPRGVRAG